MTIAELERLLESRKRVETAKQREKALNDYTLAALIGRNIARVFSDANTVPTLEEAYNWVFSDEEKKDIEEEKQKKKDKLSIIRFKQFANSFNQRNFKEVANDERRIKGNYIG